MKLLHYTGHSRFASRISKRRSTSSAEPTLGRQHGRMPRRRAQDLIAHSMGEGEYHHVELAAVHQLTTRTRSTMPTWGGGDGDLVETRTSFPRLAPAPSHSLRGGRRFAGNVAQLAQRQIDELLEQVARGAGFDAELVGHCRGLCRWQRLQLGQ